MNISDKQSLLKPILFLAFGALCVSFSPIFVKMLDRDVLGPTAIAFWRTFFGAGILFIWVILRGETLKLPRSILKFTLLAGFVFYLDLFVWHRSIIYAGAGISTILANTQVFWMALIGFLIFKEKLSPKFIGSVVIAFTGVTLLSGVGSDILFSTTYIKGIVYGLMTGLFYSSYLTFIKKMGHQKEKVSFLTVMAWTSFFCSVFVGISMLIESDPYIPPDAYSWLVLLSLAFVAQALGWWVISSNLSKLRASQSGIILLLQPTLATIWGALFFVERLSLLQIFGAGLTLTAIYFGSIKKTNK